MGNSFLYNNIGKFKSMVYSSTNETYQLYFYTQLHFRNRDKKLFYKLVHFRK